VEKPSHIATRVQRLIHLVRGHRVMLDSDLAALYRVTTANLNKAVKRNRNRFPADFAFQLTSDENDVLRFQSGISRRARHGGRRYRPYVFTQEGVAMLSSVIRSRRAVNVNIAVMRAFVRYRAVLMNHPAVSEVLRKIESTLAQQGKGLARTRRDIQTIFEIIRTLLVAPERRKTEIGFKT
jgi:hypothetical protein